MDTVVDVLVWNLDSKGIYREATNKKVPPSKGSSREADEGLFCYHFVLSQNPPPFAQGRLKVGEKYAPPLHRGGSGIDFRLPLLGEPKSQYKEKAPLQKGAFSLLILIHANGNGLRAHGMITQCYIFFSMRCYAVFRHGI